MAGLEPLTALMFHERQQPGSMLCAQHALNNLFQGAYYTEVDLANIASNYDQLELGALNQQTSTTSMNMDDTGFFSVQVMEHALEVMGLNLVRWQSEQMRKYHAKPYTHLAFILNLNQHWFTLRRFGPALPNVDDDPGEGHWFNLDSTIPEPKWISRTYLGMVLHQSEEEGYSVFAVVQADPQGPLALPRTEADNIAASLDGPDAGVRRQTAESSHMPGTFPDEIPVDRTEIDLSGMEDEDMELQAALHASMFGGSGPRHPVPAPTLREAPPPPASTAVDPHAAANERMREAVDRVSRTHQRAARREAPYAPPTRNRFAAPMSLDDDDDEDFVMTSPTRGGTADQPINVDFGEDATLAPARGNAEPEDPIAASMARSRALLERMRRVQEAALSNAYENDYAQLGASRRRTQQEEEDEEIRRAIEASMQDVEQPRISIPIGGVEEGEGGDKENSRPPGSHRPPPRRDTTADAGGSQIGAPSQPQAGHRVYDDEDAELQAALQASLETVPAGYVPPPSPPARRGPLPSTASMPPASAARESSPPSVPQPAPKMEARDESTEEEDDEEISSPPVEEQLSMEEIRRRRLAKFGG